MPEKDPTQKAPDLASNALKYPVSVSEVGLFLRNHPGAKIQVIELKTNQECLLEVNERGDLCVKVGKSRLVLEGRENQFNLTEESRAQINGESIDGAARVFPEIGGIRRYNALEINNIFATHFFKDRVETAHSSRLEEARSQPRQRLIRLYRTIVSCENMSQLRISMHRIVKYGPESDGQRLLRFKWFHNYEYQAKDMKKELSAMECKVSRAGCELWFEETITQDVFEYACKNAGLDRHLHTRK